MILLEKKDWTARQTHAYIIGMFSIRSETPADFEAIYALVTDAFAAAPGADGDEQDFVVRMRDHPGYRRDLALVAEEHGRLVGYVLLTETHIVRRGGDIPVLLLAPLCVREEHWGRGIAAALMKEGFKRGLEMGYDAVFLAGDPNYYTRFGFRSVSEHGIRHELPVPDVYILALELVPGALRGKSGTIILTGHTSCAPAMAGSSVNA